MVPKTKVNRKHITTCISKHMVLSAPCLPSNAVLSPLLSTNEDLRDVTPREKLVLCTARAYKAQKIKTNDRDNMMNMFALVFKNDNEVFIELGDPSSPVVDHPAIGDRHRTIATIW